jgi:2-iminobutanoate/2-iminopropanoate deaminase
VPRIKEAIKPEPWMELPPQISEAIRVGDMVYCSGMVALDPATDKFVEGDIEVQTDRVLRNLQIVLEAAGSSLDKVVKTTVFLAHKEDSVGMNNVYKRYFTKTPPARSTVQVGLMRDVGRVEIEAIAIV